MNFNQQKGNKNTITNQNLTNPNFVNQEQLLTYILKSSKRIKQESSQKGKIVYYFSYQSEISAKSYFKSTKNPKN